MSRLCSSNPVLASSASDLEAGTSADDGVLAGRVGVQQPRREKYQEPAGAAHCGSAASSATPDEVDFDAPSSSSRDERTSGGRKSRPRILTTRGRRRGKNGKVLKASSEGTMSLTTRKMKRKWKIRITSTPGTTTRRGTTTRPFFISKPTHDLARCLLSSLSLLPVFLFSTTIFSSLFADGRLGRRRKVLPGARSSTATSSQDEIRTRTAVLDAAAATIPAPHEDGRRAGQHPSGEDAQRSAQVLSSYLHDNVAKVDPASLTTATPPGQGERLPLSEDFSSTSSIKLHSAPWSSPQPARTSTPLSDDFETLSTIAPSSTQSTPIARQVAPRIVGLAGSSSSFSTSTSGTTSALFSGFPSSSARNGVASSSTSPSYEFLPGSFGTPTPSRSRSATEGSEGQPGRFGVEHEDVLDQKGQELFHHLWSDTSPEEGDEEVGSCDGDEQQESSRKRRSTTTDAAFRSALDSTVVIPSAAAERVSRRAFPGRGQQHPQGISALAFEHDKEDLGAEIKPEIGLPERDSTFSSAASSSHKDQQRVPAQLLPPALLPSYTVARSRAFFPWGRRTIGTTSDDFFSTRRTSSSTSRSGVNYAEGEAVVHHQDEEDQENTTSFSSTQPEDLHRHDDDQTNVLRRRRRNTDVVNEEQITNRITGCTALDRDGADTSSNGPVLAPAVPVSARGQRRSKTNSSLFSLEQSTSKQELQLQNMTDFISIGNLVQNPSHPFRLFPSLFLSNVAAAGAASSGSAARSAAASSSSPRADQKDPPSASSAALAEAGTSSSRCITTEERSKPSYTCDRTKERATAAACGSPSTTVDEDVIFYDAVTEPDDAADAVDSLEVPHAVSLPTTSASVGTRTTTDTGSERTQREELGGESSEELDRRRQLQEEVDEKLSSSPGEDIINSEAVFFNDERTDLSQSPLPSSKSSSNSLYEELDCELQKKLEQQLEDWRDQTLFEEFQEGLVLAEGTGRITQKQRESCATKLSRGEDRKVG
ncbi:unnamed protein product, partial [Amoebophrya sp. A120]|eukprot:GSA120T00007132001.1